MAASNNKRTSGNPKKRATAKTWKRNKGEDLTLPSGNVALVKRPGPAALLNGGVLPDTLMPIIQKAIKSGQGLRPEDEKDLMNDPQKLIEALETMDRLMVMVVVEPEVAFHKHQPINAVDAAWVDIPESRRNGEKCECGATHPGSDEIIYTDEVDMDDKMFIFNYAVGGTRDLERFRNEIGSRMGALLAGEGDEGETVGSPGGSEEGKAG
jgi:hypothetical protein